MKTALNLKAKPKQQPAITLNGNAQWLLRLAERIERLPGTIACDASQRMRAAAAVSTRLSVPGETVYERLRIVSNGDAVAAH